MISKSAVPIVLLLAIPGAIAVAADVLRFDFQPAGAPLAGGFTAIDEQALYSPAAGYGFVAPDVPGRSVDGSGKTWNFFGRIVTVEQAIPASVLSPATVDAVVTDMPGGAAAAIVFRADVAPGTYDVTVWIGDVTTPRFRIEVDVNGVTRPVSRADVNHLRGTFDATVIGNAVPVRIRASAPGGLLLITVRRDDTASPDAMFGTLAANGQPTPWTFLLDESPLTPPGMQTAVLVPGFNGVALQAIEIEPLADPPLIELGGQLTILDAPLDPGLQQALDLFNSGDLAAAESAFQGLTAPALANARAAGLLWVAGHPARFSDEAVALAQAEQILTAQSAADPLDFQAKRLLLEAQLAADAERYRALLGYASSGAPAVENLGRSSALCELLAPDHPYWRKCQILWLRNRGGLDPNRNTVSWERAQWNAGLLDPLWGQINPQVHLYATDEWQNDGQPWSRTDWNQLFSSGPDWARQIAANLNSWLDLFEWWTIHRQSGDGDIGGGWSDDVEIIPAFGLMALALNGASDVSAFGFNNFAEGIWNSGIVDPNAAFQAAFSDVEHAAEPSGDLLHISLLENYGDPEAIERLLNSTRTFRDVFLSDPLTSPLGHTHFIANHMSATGIAGGTQYANDIPLNARVTQPFPFLQWYAGHGGVTEPLERWARSWTEDALRAENNKPVGVFPNALWTANDLFGFDGGNGNWWDESPAAGQFDALPTRHEQLYALTGWMYRWTNDPLFLEPFTAIEQHTSAWVAAGRPALPPVPSAPFDVWAGGKLGNRAIGPLLNVWSTTGAQPAASYMARFASGYARFRLAPASANPLDELNDPTAQLIARWPYRTTEGVMTDRILVPGWADVVSYYLGADAISLFIGMPAHAVSWLDTSRLFAAAVSDASPTSFGASTYLFSPSQRTIGMRFWQLQNGQYQLEAGPSDGLGLDPQTITVSVPFTVTRPGDGLSFELPGQTTFAIRVQAIGVPPGVMLPPPPRADAGLASRDIDYDPSSQTLSLRVHNTGAVDLFAVDVAVHAGGDLQGPIVAQRNITSLPAPLDLVPRFTDLQITGVAPADAFTVLVTTQSDEVTLDNNQATRWFAGSPPPVTPPQITALIPAVAEPGATLMVQGTGFVFGMSALDSATTNPQLQLTVLDEQTAELIVGGGVTAPGQILLSLLTDNGLESNVVPLPVVAATILFADGFESLAAP